MFKKSKDNILAIDLAPDAVRILDVTFRKGVPILGIVAGAALEAGTPETLPERHLASLEKLVAENRIRARHCVAAVPTNLVVTRSMTIDTSKPQPPDEQIRATWQNTLSYDSRDMIYDFWPIHESRPSSRTHDILVVATQGSVVKRYLKGLSKLHLTCNHLDVAPCALASLIARLLPNQETMVGAIALTETLGYFAVVEKQRVLFWRPFEIGGTTSKPGIQGSLDRIGDEISKCVSHMVGSLHFDGMTEIVAFGPAAHEETFSKYLLNRFNLQVRAPSPFEVLPGESLPADIKASMAPAAATHFAAALGLALQTTGGSLHG